MSRQGSKPQPSTSTDIDEVLSPRADRVTGNAIIERFLKAMADSASLNAATFKSLAEAATAKVPKKRQRKPKRSHLAAESSDSDDHYVPKRQKIPKSSARSSVHPRGITKEACSLITEDSRVPVHPCGITEGSCDNILG